MPILKKAAAVITAAVFMFPCKAYSGDMASIEYYNNNNLVSENVTFGGDLSVEQRAFILLSVLLYNKTENASGVKVQRVFADRGELFVWIETGNRPLGEDCEFYRLTEEMTKTACSVEGIDSIIIIK